MDTEEAYVLCDHCDGEDEDEFEEDECWPRQYPRGSRGGF
jgi:hypothetical protein